MPKTDYGQMLADIHKQYASCIKKITPDLARNINMIAIELGGEVKAAPKGDRLEIQIEADAGHDKEMLQLISNKYISDIEYQHAWINEKYQIHACSITTSNLVEILVTSYPAKEKHAA
ncbi:hypothetical protein [Aquitalea magnusonii]|uniref:Uncharacterized protein n=1 Tax=Aquitalea magnusonii TaxID=332411 RepID=A0A318JIT7_9NEIS|nr:hypothetical protein [Aquitalea magnusonii]PXX49017.1 hypothetical protein DFR38_10553 [Aquitalea magnusonii]